MVRTALLLAFGVLSLFTEATAQIRLPRLISDGAVLQRDVPCAVWGWAAAHENITLELNGRKFTSQADGNGQWKIVLPSQPAGGPFEIRLSGTNEIILKDILFGDVWVCSGQSNMELTMRRVADKYRSIVEASQHNFIRQFEVPDRFDFKNARTDFENGKWTALTSTSVLDFSAVAYFFATELHNKFNVPIGLINAAVGGSPAEAWLDESSLKSFPEAFSEMQLFKNDSLVQAIEQRNTAISKKWFDQLQSKDELGQMARLPEFDDHDWQDFSLPGNWNRPTETPVNGAVWFRKHITVPERMTDKPCALWLGRIVDADSVFVNGKFVGATSYQYPPRKYALDASILKPGDNVIAVKVISQSGYGGFVLDKSYFLFAGSDTVPLSGNWKYKVTAQLEQLPRTTTVRFKPGGLYNAMIAPLHSFSIKGVIWYQGESNTGNPSLYAQLFQTLINSWRNAWQQGSFPFLFVQLASFMETQSVPAESNWAELRAAQQRALHLPNTAMVVTIDAGEWNDIHPLDKKTVGYRLSLAAQRLAYNQAQVVYSGPQYRAHKIKGNKMIISFNNVGGGLLAKGSKDLNYFAIAGTDEKFFWAQAVIKKNKVVVQSPAVSKPAHLQYAWADNPEGANLYNKEGLPASPFQIRELVKRQGN